MAMYTLHHLDNADTKIMVDSNIGKISGDINWTKEDSDRKLGSSKEAILNIQLI
ncbi:hypothetical protein [Tepidibacillus decaturensis]|uniref:hypothetical protein n=1 Tax=Tepidibacillus decaturensis TaxID=1413211 RepID=UPI00137B63F4|nr:hypothetical protein [Tepidibacillus decaturensis]